VAALSLNAKETSDVQVSSPELRIIYHTRPGSETLENEAQLKYWKLAGTNQNCTHEETKIINRET